MLQVSEKRKEERGSDEDGKGVTKDRRINMEEGVRVGGGEVGKR